MRVSLALLLAIVAAMMLGVQAKLPSSDMSLLDLSMAMPADLPEGTSDGMSAQAVAELHAAAGSKADEAIAEAERQSMLMETDSILATGSRKWDDSVPEVHLKTATRPEEVLTTELETVEHLDHARSSLTKEDLTAPNALMAAFPHSSPAILGEDHSFLQHEAQQTQVAQQQQQAQQQVQIVVATETDASHAGAAETEAESGAEAATLTEAEIAAGVVTMSDLQQMMELEGFSQQEIDQYMENLGQQTVEADAESETEGEAETEQESETETEGESETEGETESDAETEADSETEGEAETEVEGEAEASTETTESAPAVQATPEELAAYAQDAAESGIPATELLEIERKAEAEEEARLAKEQQAALVEQGSKAQFDVEAEFEAAHSADSESEQSVASDMDAEAVAEQEMEGEVETEVPLIAQQSGEDEMVHVSAQSAPAVLTEAIQATVTPIHSRSYNRRHPTLNRISQQASGYSLPQPTSMVETAARTRVGSRVAQRARAFQRSEGEELDTSKFNPSAVQLGPSKDAYGYVPMTGAEFLNAPQQPASLAQVSMQLQNQAASWLPPPIESQQVPNYVVGMGGLMPNRNAGPYQGQYAMAAGQQPVLEQPTW